MSTQGQAGITGRSPIHELYDRLIGQPVERWYLATIRDQLSALPDSQQVAIRRQALIGWLQTVLLVIVVAQSLFAGVLSVLPPDLRASVAFLHRIEWGVYLAMLLVAAQLLLSWRSGALLTNRLYLLGWRLGRPRVVLGTVVRRAGIGYFILLVLMLVATIYVRANGFILQPGK